MKRNLIVLTAVLCVGVPGAAFAGDNTTADLLDQVTRLTSQLDDAQDRLDHKSDVLACEREKRRQLERALRTGRPVGVIASCR